MSTIQYSARSTCSYIMPIVAVCSCRRFDFRRFSLSRLWPYSDVIRSRPLRPSTLWHGVSWTGVGRCRKFGEVSCMECIGEGYDCRLIWTVKMETSMSVFGNDCISTHANPTHGQHGGRIGQHMGRRGVTNWNLHRPSRAGWFVRFWDSGETKVTINGRVPSSDAHEPPCKIWRY